MEKTMISIIIPIYNVEEHIGKCLQSIISQTYSNIEIIAVNDGSTDKSGEICEQYAKKDKRIKVIHQKKSGVSVARNNGLNQVTGDYIGFVDSDDYITKNMYEKLYQACMETKSDIAICTLGREINGTIINQKHNEFTKLEFNNEGAMEELFKGNLYRFSLCNKLFNKKCFQGISFPVGRIHEDLSTTYKLFATAQKAVYINYVGYIYVKQKESILTKSYYEKRLDAFIGWDEIIGFMKQYYPNLFDIVNSCFTYSCVDHVYYVLNQVNKKKDKKKYLFVIQKHVRKNYQDIKINPSLTNHYKWVITLFNYHIGLFLLAYRITRIKHIF